MPALPRVHMDGAIANALANAFLHCGKTKREKHNEICIKTTRQENFVAEMICKRCS